VTHIGFRQLVSGILLCSATSLAGGPEAQLHINSSARKTVVLAINNENEKSIRLDDFTPGEVRFQPGDRLKIIALEFPLGDGLGENKRSSNQRRKLRLQIDTFHYLFEKVTGRWDQPQRGPWIDAKAGWNRALGNEHEYVLTEHHRAMDLSIVSDHSGSMSEGKMTAHCSVKLELIPKGKSRSQWRAERSVAAVIHTANPKESHYFLLSVLSVFIIMALCILIFGVWLRRDDKKEKTE